MEKDVALAIVQNDLEQLVALAEPASQKVSLVFFFLDYVELIEMCVKTDLVGGGFHTIVIFLKNLN